MMPQIQQMLPVAPANQQEFPQMNVDNVANPQQNMLLQILRSMAGKQQAQFPKSQPFYPSTDSGIEIERKDPYGGEDIS